MCIRGLKPFFICLWEYLNWLGQAFFGLFLKKQLTLTPQDSPLRI